MIFATVGSNRVRCHWCYCAVHILFFAVAVLKKRLILKTNAKKLPINPVFFCPSRHQFISARRKAKSNFFKLMSMLTYPWQPLDIFINIYNSLLFIIDNAIYNLYNSIILPCHSLSCLGHRLLVTV